MKINFLNRIFPFLLFTTFLTFKVTGKEIDLKIIDFNYPEGKSSIFYPAKERALILDPERDYDKYILVRSGIRNPSFRAKRTDTFFTSKIKEELCSVENVPNDLFVARNNNEIIQEKMNLFRQCIKFRVEDPKNGIIDYGPSQENCHIEKINDHTVILSGGDCFLKAKKNQTLNFEIYPDPKCHDREFLVQHGISPMEILVDLQTYIYPKNELGMVFTPTRTLWENRLIVNLNPGSELLKTISNEDFERNIVFHRIEYFVIPDILISSLKFFDQKTFIKMDLGFLISTFGGSNFCESGICSSYLNFDVPVAPFLVLFEWDTFKKRKIELSSSGRVGDRFPGQWNGEFISSDYLTGFTFEKGKKYSLELIFSDPNEDYNRLKDNYRSLLGPGGLGFGPYRAGESVLRTLGGYSGLGSIEGLPSLNHGEIFGAIAGISENFFPRILESIQDFSFPPHYSKVCNKDISVCKKITSKEYLKFIITFEVEDIENSQVILGEDITIERVSDLLPNLTTKLNLQNKPSIICK